MSPRHLRSCVLMGLLIPALAYAAPVISTPSVLSFGSAPVGSYPDLNLTIQNLGNQLLVVNSFGIVGSSDFSFPSAPLPPLNVPVAGVVSVTVRFAPTSRGVKTGTITIGSNDPAVPTRYVSVSGVGVGPQISVSNAIAFGGVNVSSFSERMLQVRNVGDSGYSLTVSGITFAGPDSAAFAFGAAPPTLPFVIAAGGTVNVPIRFSPASAESMTAMLSIASNDPLTPSGTVSLTGTGIATTDVPAGTALHLALAHPVPNPARDGAEFGFTMPREGRATLRIFDAQGRRVATMVDGPRPAGRQSARWTGRDDDGRVLPDGVYFARLVAADASADVRFSLVR